MSTFLGSTAARARTTLQALLPNTEEEALGGQARGGQCGWQGQEQRTMTKAEIGEVGDTVPAVPAAAVAAAAAAVAKGSARAREGFVL
jgi:hypothetical protein